MSLLWHWQRLRAMEPSEPFLRIRKKFREIQDSGGPPAWPSLDLSARGSFPKLPDPQAAPETLRHDLAAHVSRILQRRWLAFGRLPLQVDDPPCWQKDYLAGKDLQTTESAFNLNYRKIEGADSKLIWELSRWFELVRLGQAAYVLQDSQAAEKCRAWLRDWVVNNPPFRGWNWVSALESGMRLIQFAWLDALLDLREFRKDIVPAHFWHAWRHRSFGSSANNHLLGELAGVVVALVRWPGLGAIGPSLELAQKLWEAEVLAQFAPDGGNREQ